MSRIERCSRCHELLGEDYQDLTNLPLYTEPKILCKKCMDSFLEWREIMRSKEAKE